MGRQPWVPAWWAVRQHPATAGLLILAGAATVGTVMPVTSLASLGGLTRISFAAAPAVDAGLGWGAATATPAASAAAAAAGLFGVLLLAAAAVLGIGALTLLALAAARLPTRDADISVSRAVGAPRATLLRAALIEGGGLAFASLLVGGFIGGAGLRVATTGWSGSVIPAPVTLTVGVALVVTLILVAGAVFPVVMAPTGKVPEPGPSSLTLWLPALQLGLTLVVLAGGTIVARQARGLASHAAAHAGAGGEILEVDTRSVAPAERARRYERLLALLGARGLYDSVSLASPGAIVGLGEVRPVTTECGICAEGNLMLPWRVRLATHQFVSADSFGALGIRVVAGRGITAGDRWGAEPVVVVNRALAAEQFQHGEAIGRRVKVGDAPGAWYRVIGIADSPPSAAFGAGVQPRYVVYLSVLQHPMSAVELLVRRRQADPSALPRVAQTLGVTPAAIRSSSEAAALAAAGAPFAWFARWLTVEGAGMLLVAVLGTFVLMRLWVVSLAAELGLRRAMGAPRKAVLSYVLLRAAAAGAGAAVFGLAFGPAAWHALAAVMRDLPAWDAALAIRLGLLLVAAAIAGALAPAWRAAVVPPAVLLASPGE